MNVKRFAVLLVVALVPTMGCSIGSVVVHVEDNGSGRMEFNTLKLDQVGNMPDIEGARHERSLSYTLQRSTYTFDDLSSVSFEWLTFDRTKEDGFTEITTTIPLQVDARWVKQLAVTKQRIKDLRKRLNNMAERLAQRETPMEVDPEDALKLKFEINVPREIDDVQVDAPDLDDHDWVSERNTKNRAAGDNQVVIDIPVRAIMQDEPKNLSLRVRYSDNKKNDESDGNDNGSEDDVQTY